MYRPDWKRKNLVAALFLGLCASTNSPAQTDSFELEELVELEIGGPVFSWFERGVGRTQLFYRQREPVFEYLEVDAQLNREHIRRLIAVGEPRVAEDLDDDGEMELILHRIVATEDPPQAFLDIRSAPDWRLRSTLSLPEPGETIATVVDVDDDQVREVFLTCRGLSRTVALLLDYDAAAGQFYFRSAVDAFQHTGGKAVVADFDDDDRIEFVVGSIFGHVLFEWDNGLHYRGRVLGDPSPAGESGVSVVQLNQQSPNHLLLSRSDPMGKSRHWLLRPEGDNTFETVSFWEKDTGVSAQIQNHAIDLDEDGNDEMVLRFFPWTHVYEWDSGAQRIVRVAEWDSNQYGTAFYFGEGDLDRDGIRELWMADNRDFRALELVLDPASTPETRTDAQLRLQVEPNPVQSVARLSLNPSVAPGNWTFGITDASGRTRRSWTAELRGGTSFPWDSRDSRGNPLPSGHYWLTGRSETGEVVKSPLVIVR